MLIYITSPPVHHKIADSVHSVIMAFHRFFTISAFRIRVEIKLPDGTLFLGPGWHEVKYSEEDPQVLKDYKEALAREGAEFTMPESAFRDY